MIPQAEKERWRQRKEAFSREHPTEIEIIQHLDELYNRLDSQNPLEAKTAAEQIVSSPRCISGFRPACADLLGSESGDLIFRTSE